MTTIIKILHIVSKRLPHFFLFLYCNSINSFFFFLYLMRQNTNGIIMRTILPKICIIEEILSLFKSDDRGRKKVQYQHIAINKFPSPGLFFSWWNRSPVYQILSIKYQNRKAKKDAQLRVFLTLMADRKSTPITKEWVDALNTIDVVFQENKKVRHAWREYLDSLNEKSPHFDSSNSFRLDLLSEMAVSLGYKNLKQTEIDRFYSPKYFGSQMSRQEILFQENLRILTRSKSCAESFTDEEYEQHYKELMEQQGE